MDYQLKSFAKFLISFAVVGFLFIYGPLLGVQARYNFKQITGAAFNLSARPLDYDFDIVIPKIEANSKVYKNVNPGKYSEYIEILRKGVAHAAGTGLPGETKNIFLFAHSSVLLWELGRVNPVFYLLNKLESRDLIILYYQGQKYDYKVVEKKIISPKEVKDINEPGNDSLLILQTCWPAGTNFKRLLVTAKLV